MKIRPRLDYSMKMTGSFPADFRLWCPNENMARLLWGQKDHYEMGPNGPGVPVCPISGPGPIQLVLVLVMKRMARSAIYVIRPSFNIKTKLFDITID